MASAGCPTAAGPPRDLQNMTRDRECKDTHEVDSEELGESSLKIVLVWIGRVQVIHMSGFLASVFGIHDVTRTENRYNQEVRTHQPISG